MEKRLKAYLILIDEQLQFNLSADEKKTLKENLLTQIMFFQHERLIHLIVTVTFAVLTVISFICVLLYENIVIAVFLLLLVALLVPYIRHNYILEKGVQKLYEYYDKL
ncbi:MAG: hypothetical protein WCN92_06250 [Eubacteriales bacterium]